MTNKINRIHLLFLSLLAIHYILPLFLIGQITLIPHDNLDMGAVYDHVIGKIYKGDFSSINYFLSGNIKWYFIEELFYPLNILHYFLSDKLFYFTDGILKKLFAYFSFYLLAKSLNNTKTNSAFGAILYTAIINIEMPHGIGLSILPYILYILINKNFVNNKNYFFLFLIGLNTSLVQDIFAFFLLIPLAFIISDKRINLKNCLQIFLTLIIACIISNLHLVIGSFAFDPIHRSAMVAGKDSIFPFFEVLRTFFLYTDPKHFLFIFSLPLAILTTLIVFFSFFVKQKKIKFILFFIFIILLVKSLVKDIFISNFFIGIFEPLNTINFERLARIIPITFSLLFILFISEFKYKKLKKILYFVLLISVVMLQLRVPLPIIGEALIKENMNNRNYLELKKFFKEKKYTNFVKIILNKENYNNEKINFNIVTDMTFDNYYQFENYKIIKSIVKESRVMSVGLDPLVAVMNNIKVIDGYHNIYPLDYKIKFRKVIENELDKNSALKKYYDNWGSRVYAFYNNKNNIMINFREAKKLGADYIISKFPIKNEELKIICNNCNNSSIFLYQII